MTVLRARLLALATAPATRITGTVVAVVILVRSLNVASIGATLTRADARLVGAASILTVLGVMASMVAWGVLLRAGSARRVMAWTQVSSCYLQSLFFSQMLPAGVGGDAMRTVDVAKRTGVGRALASAAGSRLSTGLGMALWGLAAAVVLRDQVGRGGVAGTAAFAALMIVVAMAALSADKLIHRVPWSRLRARLGGIGAALARLRARPRAIAVCALLTAAGWGINLCALAVFGHSVGASVDWSIFAVALPLSLVATFAPFTFNGVGLREGVLAGLLVHSGVSASAAAAIALFVDLQMVPFALIGAALWLRRSRLAPSA